MTNATFDTTPGIAVIDAVAAEKWTASGAISELVDNAFGKIRGDASQVVINYDRSKNPHIMTIIDNGRGMDHIGRLFKLANGSGIGIGDIGRWGSGGTKALMWLATDIRIWSMQNGNVMHDHIRWQDHKEEWPRVNDSWEPASLRNTPTALFQLGHGTMIELKVRSKRTVHADAVQRDLEETYSPGLRKGKGIKWITVTKGRELTRTLRGDLLQLPEDPKRIVNFNIAIDLGKEQPHLPVSGTVALIDDLPFKHSNIAIGFGHRIIFRTRACYQSIDGQKKYSGAGIGGWLDLGHGWQEYLTTVKDEINDDHIRAALMNHVFNEIEPLLKQVEEDQLSMLLDGIAIDLCTAIGNLNQNTDNLVGYADMRALPPLRDDSVNPIIPDPPVSGDNVISISPPKVVEDDPNKDGPNNKKERPIPPVAQIRLDRQTDDFLDHALCRVPITSDRDNIVSILVNKEHPVVLELLQSKPLNRMALHLMLTRELAAALIDHPLLQTRILSPKIRHLLEVFPDNGSRERYLARILMDSARRPKVESDAA
jgi:hypothetical protein